MSDRNGHICPQCGAPWESGGSPTCGCARRAADELLETRTAEAAAAEDFDPLRIRPYVDLGVRAEGSPVPDPGTPAAPPSTPADPDAPAALADPADPDARPTVAIPVQRTSPDQTSTLDAPAAPGSPGTRDTLFEGEPQAPAPFGTHDGYDGYDAEDSDDPAGNTSRRRRFVLVGAGATVAVIAAAGFATGLFSYESPSRSSAAPDDIRASVPDAAVEEPSPSDSGSTSASPSASPSESTGESASPSASESSTASATPSRTTGTTDEPVAENPTTTTQPPSVPPEKAEPVVLRRGDEGPEVVELQLRLKQLTLYIGEADGTYDNRTENAVRNYQFTRGVNGEQGTYDLITRQRLESETEAP